MPILRMRMSTLQTLIRLTKYELLKVSKSRMLWIVGAILSMYFILLVLNVGTYSGLTKTEVQYYEKVITLMKIENENKEEILSSEICNLQKKGDYLKIDIINRIVQEKNYVEGYSERIQTIMQNGQKMKDTSVFANSSFSSRNIGKTTLAFMPLQDIKLVFGNYLGQLEIILSSREDIIYLLVMVIFVLIVITEDHVNSDFMYSNSIARSKIIIAKLFALFSISVFLFLLLRYIHFIWVKNFYGFEGMDELVQTSYEFVNHTTLSSYKQMYINSLIYKFCSSLGFLLFVAACYEVCKNSYIATLFVCVFLLVEYLLYTLISNTSYLAILKYFNIINNLNVKTAFIEYLNVNVAGYPIEICRISIIVTVLLVVIALWLFSLSIGHSKLYFSKCIISFPNIYVVINDNFNLILQEGFNILVNKKTIILLIVVLSINAYKCFTFSPIITSEMKMYNQYISRFQGYYDENKEEMITNERKRIELSKNYMLQKEAELNAKQITIEEYYYSIEKLNDLEIEDAALRKIENQIRNNHSNTKYILNEDAWNYVFQSTLSNEEVNYAYFDTISMVFQAIVCTVLMFGDKRKDNIFDYSTVTISQHRIQRYRLAFYIVFLEIIFFSNQFRYMFYANEVYGLSTWTATVDNLKLVSSLIFPKAPIYIGISIIYFLKYLILLLIGMISSVVTDLFDNRQLSSIVCVIIFIFPLIGLPYDVPFLSNVSIAKYLFGIPNFKLLMLPILFVLFILLTIKRRRRKL